MSESIQLFPIKGTGSEFNDPAERQECLRRGAKLSGDNLLFVHDEISAHLCFKWILDHYKFSRLYGSKRGAKNQSFTPIEETGKQTKIDKYWHVENLGPPYRGWVP